MDPTALRQPVHSRWTPPLILSLSEATELATASTMLANRGILVFPCVPGGKQPLTSHGFHDASTDLSTVERWWRRWPDANIGMPTGAASGVDVVDVDVHARGNGFDAFERARSAGLADGWACLVRTPSGGVHAYYPRDDASEQRSWQVPHRHVDFRGDGGYIVVPPSCVRTGSGTARAYRQLAIAQHQPLPVDAAALRRFLDPPRPAPSPAGLPAVGIRPDRLAAWVASRPEGARNHGLFRAACLMVEQGHPFETTASLLGDAARSAGLGDREVSTTIHSAYRRASRLGPANGSTRRTEAVTL